MAFYDQGEHWETPATKKCVACFSEIRWEATRCRFCTEQQPEAGAPPPRRQAENHAGPAFNGYTGCVLPVILFFAAAFIMGIQGHASMSWFWLLVTAPLLFAAGKYALDVWNHEVRK